MAAKTVLQLAREAEHRFWPKVDKRGPDECWPWIGYQRRGNGFFHMASRQLWSSRRLAWILSTGGDPGRSPVRHKCGNGLCCNPDHLSLAGVPLKERFEAFVDRSGGSDACHLWQGYTGGRGYGHISVKNKAKAVHRLAFRFEYGRIPAGYHVLHKCDVRACVNPGHLFLGSNDDNVKDMIKKGRQARGERSGQAKLTEAEVKDILSLRGRLSMQEIGEMFGVSRHTVGRIHCGKRWRHITASDDGEAAN